MNENDLLLAQSDLEGIKETTPIEPTSPLDASRATSTLEEIRAIRTIETISRKIFPVFLKMLLIPPRSRPNNGAY
jgi:hypothetical protein